MKGEYRHRHFTHNKVLILLFLLVNIYRDALLILQGHIDSDLFMGVSRLAIHILCMGEETQKSHITECCISCYLTDIITFGSTVENCFSFQEYSYISQNTKSNGLLHVHSFACESMHATFDIFILTRKCKVRLQL